MFRRRQAPAERQRQPDAVDGEKLSKAFPQVGHRRWPFPLQHTAYCFSFRMPSSASSFHAAGSVDLACPCFPSGCTPLSARRCGMRGRVWLLFIDPFFARSWAFSLADGSFSGHFARGCTAYLTPVPGEAWVAPHERG